MKLDLKQILDLLRYSLGYIAIQILGKYLDTQHDFGTVILAYFINIYIFKVGMGDIDILPHDYCHEQISRLLST